MDMRKAILAAVIGLLPASTLHAAGAEDAAFGGDCVMGLAVGKDIHTDCSVNTVYKGKKYCFGNETARTLFLKRPDDFLLQAYIYHSTREAMDAAEAADGGK